MTPVRHLLWAVTLGACLAALFAPSWTYAAKPAQKVCEEVGRKAGRVLWGSLRESGDELFCRKSWVLGLPDELAACALWSQSHLFSNKLRNRWNKTFSDAEWATWGARAIHTDWEEGTIRGGFKRTFFGAGLAYTNSTFEVVNEGGRAEATVTACVLDHDGNVIETRQRTFESGKGGEGTTVKMSFQHRENRILALVVDTPASVNSFEYRARQLVEPRRINTDEVKGIADLHVHQLANLAFAGRLLWGQHAGPEETALAPEVVAVGPVHAGATIGNVLESLADDEVSLDANVFFKLLGGPKSDEGFWQVGGGGHPKYEKWPHHADRSHQQVHISWLEAAHERNRDSGSNLQLVVVSLVNNDVLCTVAKAIDPNGNVPRRNTAGKITGWESSTWGCSDHENVMRQLEALHDLERAYPWFRIAMTPWHARQIIADGDLAVVVSMETDKPLSSEGNDYGNWEHQLDRYRAMGLTTLQIVHESDSIFCGAAPHRDMMELVQALRWPTRFGFKFDGNRHNLRGLTDEGKRLLDAMKKRNMPIDIAHGSSRCREQLMRHVGRGYALYDSHTKFERLLDGHVLAREQEFLITERLLPLYREHQVLVGLRTASVDVKEAPGGKVANDCPGSARSFAQLVQYATDQGLDIAYGSDFNTGVSQLGPRYGAGRCWAAHEDIKDRSRRKASPTEGEMPKRYRTIQPIAGTNYYVDGLATIGWLPELTVDRVENLKTPGADKLRRSAEAYLRMWERAYPQAGSSVTVAASDTKPRTSLPLGSTCTSGDECQSGRCTGVAGAKGVCVCNEDADCGAGRYCDAGPDLKKNQCLAKKDDNEPCAIAGGGHQCKSGDMHWKDARAAGESEHRLYGVSAFRECGWYSVRERAALAWTEALTRLSEGPPSDSVRADIQAHFSEKEQVDLTWAIGIINTWNRLCVAFHVEPGTYQPAKHDR